MSMPYERKHWYQVPESMYDEALNVLPPAAHMSWGFLVGEPYDDCPDTGRPRYPAFVNCNGKFYGGQLLTRSAFKMLNIHTAVVGAIPLPEIGKALETVIDLAEENVVSTIDHPDENMRQRIACRMIRDHYKAELKAATTGGDKGKHS